LAKPLVMQNEIIIATVLGSQIVTSKTMVSQNAIAKMLVSHFVKPLHKQESSMVIYDHRIKPFKPKRE